MKHINFGWPLCHGLCCLALAIGALVLLVKSIFEGYFTLNMLFGTLLAAGLFGLIAWVFVKIAYANKERDKEYEVKGY